LRDSWYGDKRDLVKWGTLVYLARYYGARTILQVPFFRSDQAFELLVDGKDVGLPVEVWGHFRTLGDVKRLGQRCGLKIEVFDLPFASRHRASYIAAVVSAIAKQGETKIVLLDPDTGIERKSGSPVGPNILPR
jgi:hypothetical protein